MLMDPQSVKIRFRTSHPDGLILWTARRQDEMAAPAQDFFALALENGYVHLRYDLGSGQVLIADNSTRVDDGLWHIAKVTR